MIHPLSPQYIKELLDYNPNDGRFIWKQRVLRGGLERIDKGWNKRFAGNIVAERVHRHGHLQIGLHCKNYMAHRVAWAIYYSEWPSTDLDHINGDPRDNRINNLRLATESENLCNSKIRIDNTSGVKGISWNKQANKWYAYISKDGKMFSLGYYSSFEEATAVRRAAELKYHGEFARAA